MSYFTSISHMWRYLKHSTVCAESITELILERAGPVILKTFFTGINRFQTDSSNLSSKKSKA